MDAKSKWEAIALHVGKTSKECVARFKELRDRVQFTLREYAKRSNSARSAVKCPTNLSLQRIKSVLGHGARSPVCACVRLLRVKKWTSLGGDGPRKMANKRVTLPPKKRAWQMNASVGKHAPKVAPF